MEQMTRRTFVSGAVATAALGAAAASATVSVANAEDISDEDCSWVGEEIQIDEADIVETRECEVLICGAGTGGMYAALFLADKGVKPLIIEKMGSNGGPTLDVGAFNSRFMEEHGDHMDPAVTYHELINYSTGRADSRLIKLWMDNSAQAISELDDVVRKYEFGEVVHTGSYSQMNAWDSSSVSLAEYVKNPTDHGVKSTIEDVRVSESMAKTIVDLGGEFLFWTGLVKIEHEGQKVTGVIAENEDGKYIRINSEKGVIVATGGYHGNREVYEKLQPHTVPILPRVDNLLNQAGDGHRACLWLGACMDDVHTSMLFDRRAIFPGESAPDNVTSDMKSSKLGSQPFLKLNCYGKRFCNESQPYDYVLHEIANFPEHFFVDVFDSNFASYIKDFEMIGCSRYFDYPSQYEDYASSREEILDYLQNRIDGELEKMLEEGYCVTADTIEELAEKAQLPVDEVVASVNRYNEMCAAGEDTDFYKEAYRLTPVLEPPFYAVRFCGRMLVTIDGIRPDENLHPYNKAGEPFENLWVTGNVSGGFFANTYPSHFIGLAGGRTLTWSWLIANQIAAM